MSPLLTQLGLRFQGASAVKIQRSSLNCRTPTGSIEDLSWTCGRHGPILICDLAIDDDVGEAFSVLVRFVVSRHVTHAGRIEHRNVGLHSRAQNSTIVKSDTG